jgi:hypothetical protein
MRRNNAYFDVIGSWHTELKRMNCGKKGVKYYYPDSFVELLGYMRVYFHLPYRQTEGVVRAHANEKVPSIQITVLLTGVSISLISKSTKRLIMTL